MTAARWAPLRIPTRQPHQVHLSEGMDQWLGDSPRAARKARGGCTDTNLHPLADGAGAIHARTPRESGYHFIQTGRGRRRPLTATELDRPFEQWHRRDFIRLRRTKRWGPRYESRVRPQLFAEVLANHQKYGAIPVCEIKAPFPKRIAIAMVDLANRRRQTVWFKAMVFQSVHAPRPPYSMAVAGEKLRTFHAAGAQTALATHGYPPPTDLDVWRDFIDAYWGVNAVAYRPTKETR